MRLSEGGGVTVSARDAGLLALLVEDEEGDAGVILTVEEARELAAELLRVAAAESLDDGVG